MSDEDRNIAVYTLIKDVALQKLRDEQKRETEIIDQSRTTQTVFSVLAVALFTLLPILLEYVGEKGQNKPVTMLIVITYSIVLVVLLISFVLSLLIQLRIPKAGLPDIAQIKKEILDNFNDFSKKSSQLNSLIDTLSSIQIELTKVNNRNVRLLNLSMRFILASVYFIALFSILILEAVLLT